MKKNISKQRKTTLKWNPDGELSSIDKARIIERLTKKELSECTFSCDINDSEDTQ